MPHLAVVFANSHGDAAAEEPFWFFELLLDSDLKL